MTIPSNLYAEKIYSEHPIGLWPFDEDVRYISFISDATREIQEIAPPVWTTENCFVAPVGAIVDIPFPDSPSSRVEGFVPTGTSETLKVVSPVIINSSNLNSEMQTFSLGSYVYIDTPYLASISIGYQYQDPDTLTDIITLKTFNTNVFSKWVFISGTFDIPSISVDLKMIFEITYSAGGASMSDYGFIFNGLSFGQWSEEFNATSLGTEPIVFPSNIALENIDYAVESQAYGLDDNLAYYISSSNKLFAKNTSVPMVYGASGVTKLYPNPDGPSLIIPGNGMLNNKGKFLEYTAEFWLKVNADTNVPKRIFGPISSDDGLYIEYGFLVLKVGDNFASYFVSEWFRPMLIDVKVRKNYASLMVNGEEVSSISFITQDVDFPDELDINNKSQDWLGFYSYDELSPIEIDAVALYQYSVPDTVAKRRWVYGQGVVSPETINSAYGGTSASIDYMFADYTANYNYPNFAKWNQGNFDNLESTTKLLKTPSYSLPTLYINSGTEADLLSDCYSAQSGTNNFFTFRPNSSWNSTNGYLYFPRLNTINGVINAFYGVFKVDSLSENEQILLYIKHKNTQDYFKISIINNNIVYSVNLDEVAYEIISPVDGNIDGGMAETVIFEALLDAEYYNSQYTNEISGGSFADVESSIPFVVGIKINDLIAQYGYRVAKFFGDIASLELYVGGNKELDKTFTGKILSVGISNSSNSDYFANGFESNGIAKIDFLDPFLNNLATYTLVPTVSYERFYLDIGISGYWEDYMPLSYFAQYVQDYNGDRIYDLDFLQFNIGYPKPVQNDGTYFDTDTHEVRSFITFQYLESGNNLLSSNFIYEESPLLSGLLDIDSYSSWQSTRFEVVDGTVIYPRSNYAFNDFAIVYRVEFNVRNTINKPVAISKLELCSQAFNKNSFNRIGTKFAKDIYPYKKSGLYYDYKAKNPYSIYKESSPYLYLNKSSGIKLLGNSDGLLDRGIAIPVNEFLSSNYRVSAVQLWTMFDGSQFSNTPVKIFEIEYKDDKVLFYVAANGASTDRGRVYAILASTGQEYQGISYYINGRICREPVLSLMEWTAIGIKFSIALSFDSSAGFINLNGPFIFNNVSYYQANNIQQLQGEIFRPWAKVLSDGITTFDWDYWDSFTWNGVLVSGTSDLYGVNPSDIYDTYSGTNKIIFDDDMGIEIDPVTLRFYKDISWSSTVHTPA